MGLSVNTTYDWYVSIFDGTNTTLSSIYNFTTSKIPNEPTVNNPANGAVNQPSSVNLNITVTDPDGDAMNVSFYPYANNSFEEYSSTEMLWTNTTYSSWDLSVPQYSSYQILNVTALGWEQYIVNGEMIMRLFSNGYCGKNGTSMQKEMLFNGTLYLRDFKDLSGGGHTFNSSIRVYKNGVYNFSTGASASWTTNNISVLKGDIIKIIAYTGNGINCEWPQSSGDKFLIDFLEFKGDSISIQTNISNGSDVTYSWVNLADSQTYFWYASITDGYGTRTSSTYNFTTSSAAPVINSNISIPTSPEYSNETYLQIDITEPDGGTINYCNFTVIGDKYNL